MSEFKTKMEGAALLVVPEGIIDVNNAPAFHEAVSNSMAGVTEVIFDFADLVGATTTSSLAMRAETALRWSTTVTPPSAR